MEFMFIVISYINNNNCKLISIKSIYKMLKENNI